MNLTQRTLCIKALHAFAKNRAPENWTAAMRILDPEVMKAMWAEGEAAEWLAVQLGAPMIVHPTRNAAKDMLLGVTDEG